MQHLCDKMLRRVQRGEDFNLLSLRTIKSLRSFTFLLFGRCFLKLRKSALVLGPYGARFFLKMRKQFLLVHINRSWDWGFAVLTSE